MRRSTARTYIDESMKMVRKFIDNAQCHETRATACREAQSKGSRSKSRDASPTHHFDRYETLSACEISCLMACRDGSRCRRRSKKSRGGWVIQFFSPLFSRLSRLSLQPAGGGSLRLHNNRYSPLGRRFVVVASLS